MTKTQVNFIRERMFLQDGDFIDLDLSSVHADEVVIAIHGLEGSAQSSYIRSLTKTANQQGIDVVAVNLRGCSGEQNLKLPSYHSGKTEDLAEIVAYVADKKNYTKIHLVGYSLGGNMTLKFMGEYAHSYAQKITSAVGISVPCDLEGSGVVLNKNFNKIYQANFLKTLKQKARYKIENFPGHNLEVDKIIHAKNFAEFDEYFTAATHGFLGAADYYKRASCLSYIPLIQKPSLLITALDDPFLSTSCYPFEVAKNHPNFTLRTPKYGGHVGFYTHFQQEKNGWLEDQILRFVKKGF